MACSRSAAELALMAFVLSAVSFTYALGAFVMALALHPPNQRGWSVVETIAVGLYAVGWLGLMFGAAELWTRRQRRDGKQACGD